MKGTFLECPATEAECPKFNSSAPKGEKEFAKACIIDCVLPTVVPAVAKGLSLQEIISSVLIYDPHPFLYFSFVFFQT